MQKHTNWQQTILPYLPNRIADTLSALDQELPLEEIRIRAGRPIQLFFSGFERLIYAPGGKPMASREDCDEIVSRLCGYSAYAWEKEMSGSFITIHGGCRVGICGRIVQAGEKLCRITEVSSINFRIARAVLDVARTLAPLLCGSDRRVLSALLFSAPGCGKTTMLRDLARVCSDGKMGLKPHRVVIVDTRYEIAGCASGVPYFDVGTRTDVRSGGGRAEGIRQMVRTMSPELLITDELSSTEDAYAVLDAASAGVTVLASAHAGSMETLFQRPPLIGLLHERVFSRYVLLDRSRGTGTVRAVFDANGKRIEEVAQPWQRLLRC